MTHCLVLSVLFFLSMVLPTQAAVIYPGFKTVGVWVPEAQVRLDLAVWYPTARAPSDLDYGDFVLRASRGAPPLPGLYPLLVLSHDNAGSRFSLHQLAAALTKYGFVVAAPTHLSNNIDNMDSLFGLEQLSGRCKQISSTIDVLLADAETGPIINPERIGVLGVGPGGTAALMLAGARLDAAGWTQYCSPGAELHDPYCSPWTARRMEKLVAQPNLGASFRDKRVRAVVAVAPHYGMFLTLKSLSRIRIPMLLARAGKDPMSRVPVNRTALAQTLPVLPQYASIPEAGPATLMSSCSETLAPTLPELCLAVSEDERETVQRQLVQLAGAFFQAELTAAVMPPVLPDYQEPTPPAPPQPPAPPKRVRRR